MSAKHDDLCKLIRLYLSQVGILSIDTPTHGILFDPRGKPVRSSGKGKLDIHACAPVTMYDKQGTPQLTGVYIAIDAKVGKDKLHDEQLNYAKAVNKRGGIAFQAYSVDDVRNMLILKGIISDDTTPNAETKPG